MPARHVETITPGHWDTPSAFYPRVPNAQLHPLGFEPADAPAAAAR